jgi:segregation and condensation protein B
MFATTKQFLDYFNLESLQQLPALSEIRDIDGGAKDLGFEAELAAARVLEMPENAEDDSSLELSDDEKAEMLAEEEAIALSQKPLDEILHPNGRPEVRDEEDDEDYPEDNDDFAEIDEALAALEQNLGGDPVRLGEAIAGEKNEGQLSFEESEGESDDVVPTE